VQAQCCHARFRKDDSEVKVLKIVWRIGMMAPVSTNFYRGLSLMILGVLLPFFVLGGASALTISELMYHPVASPLDPPEPDSGEALEYIELYNEGPETEELGGYAFVDGVVYVFPQEALLSPRSFLLVASNPDALRAFYSERGVDLSEVAIYGPYEGFLDNAGERVELQVEGGGQLLRMGYNDGGRWPAGADGTGHSLELLYPFYDPDEPESWEISESMGGTPGTVGRFTIPTFDPGTTLPSTEWTEEGFDDSAWLEGPTPIGYDVGGGYPITTQLPDMRYGYTTLYMRVSFELDDTQGIESLLLQMFYEDGFVAYLNGTEVVRSPTMGGAPGIPPAYNSTCSNRSPEPTSYDSFNITSFAGQLVEGRNWLAIHGVNTNLSSSDFVMSARFVATRSGEDNVLVEEGGQWRYFKGTLEPVIVEDGDEGTRHHTPGSPNHEPVVINEFLAKTTQPDAGDWIELYNRGDEPADVGGMYLSDDADDLARFRIPDGLTLGAGDYCTFTREQLGFGLGSFGEKIFLTAADLSRVMDAVNYGEHVLPEVSYGRYPDGADEWCFLPNPSPGSPNFIEVEDSIVINEIMYHPITEDSRDEYIELYNRGTQTVDLSGWRLSKAISFGFPPGLELGPGEYLVVAKDEAHLRAKYGIDNVVGDYDGVLANDGESIRLRDEYDNIVDVVRYYDGGTWPDAADGEGSSLELTDPRDDNNVAAAWAASDETGESGWTPFSHTSVHRNWWRQPENELHVFLQHRGEALVDDLSVSQGATEFLTNGSFEAGTSGWKIDGTHVDSFVTTGDSVGGSRSLHIVASGRGDTYCNHIESDTSSLTLGQTYTISGQARWLKGSRWLLVRTHAQGMACAVKMQVPERLGSPGRQNGAFAPNRGPSITQVQHSPILPKPGGSVTVTARIADIDGVSGVQLYYRIDGSGSFSSTAMSETGAPGSGIYVGQIPGQTNGTLMNFYVRATDGIGASNTFPADPVYRQCLYQVVASPVLSNFPVYRILFPSSTAQRLGSNPRLMSNHLLPCSFIYDDTEIYYNCWARLRGSPFIRRGYGNPVSSKCGLRIRFSPDNPLHGRREMNLDIQNPRGGMSSLQNERIAYWICRKIGIPWSQIRFARVLCNQTDHGLYGDVQKVDVDYLSFWFPGDDDGYLYKVDDWFEFDDAGNFNNRDADLRYWEGGNLDWWGEEKELYRWNYRPRSRDEEDNIEPIVNLISKMDRQMSASDTQYVRAVESVLDVEEALKEIAVRHVVGDWDSWGYNRGKNNLLYQRPSDNRFVLIPWDIDFVLGSGDGPTNSLTATSLYGFRDFFSALGEEYNRALWEIAEGPLAPGAADEYLDRTHVVLSQEGLGVGSPDGIKSYLATRRNFILQQLERPVAITTNDGEPFTTTDPGFVLTGTAPYDAETMTLNGQPVQPVWTSPTSWALPDVLSQGVNDLTIEIFDGEGYSLGTARITITLNPFVIHTLVMGPDRAFLAWSCTPGETYTVLAGETPLASTVVATDLLAQAADLFYFDHEAPLFRRRFYRVKIGGLLVLPGLTAEYFRGTNFDELLLTRVDDAVDFNWGTGSPAPDVPADSFSVRWTGFIIAEKPGLHTFWTDSDDGVRLTIAGETIIDNWTDHSPTLDQGDIFLSSGTHPLLLEYYENSDGAGIRLEFSAPGIPQQTVPGHVLGHEP
jgi:hypothetical protein